jgi:hypothetical protein
MSSLLIDHLLDRDGTLLVRSQTGEDEYGDRTYGVVEQQVRCTIQPGGSREENQTGTQVSTWQVFLPADTSTLRGWDAVEIDQGLYELNGDPQVWRSPVTGLQYVQAYTVRTTFTSTVRYTELGTEYRTYQELTDTRQPYSQLSPEDDYSASLDAAASAAPAAAGHDDWAAR